MNFKNILYLILISTFIGFYSCAKDDIVNDKPLPDDKPKEKIDSPKSVVINAANISMPGSGTITVQYSDSPAGNGIEKIIDNNPDSKFSIESNKVWILWKSDEAFIATDYFITSADGSSENDPKSWTLTASNDNTTWKTLASSANASFSSRKQKKVTTFKNETTYQYYKLSISSNNGGSKIEIADWGLTKKKVEPKSIRIISSNLSMPVMGIISVQYNDSPASDDIDKIVDNNADTKYTANYNKVWIVWKGNSAVNVEEYHLTSSSDDQKNDPKSWTLSASNDSVIWTTLDAKNDFVFTERKSKKKFPISDKTPYLYFRLDITSNNGGSLTQVAEWGLKKPITMEDLMHLASGYSKSSITPMGKHYENRHVTTDSDKSWLLVANNEPPAPGSLNDGAEWKELPVTLYPFGEPVPADINQHDIGDCGGIAALASMAYLYPDFIKSIITDNGDKTYTIDMFDPQGKAVKLTVSSTFLVRKDNKRIAAVSSKSDKACWSTILEKAIMKYNVIYKVNPDIGGIGSEHVPPLFTGDGGSFAFSPGVLNNEQLKRAVEASLDEGKLVIGGFNQAVQFGNTKTVTGHAFTFMYSTDSNALFTMRNPWGFNPNTDGKDDGVLHIPDNGYIPPLIDLRIVNPGKAVNMKKDIEPYIPPVFSSVTHELRVNPALMASGM